MARAETPSASESCFSIASPPCYCLETGRDTSFETAELQRLADASAEKDEQHDDRDHRQRGGRHHAGPVRRSRRLRLTKNGERDRDHLRIFGAADLVRPQEVVPD